MKLANSLWKIAIATHYIQNWKTKILNEGQNCIIARLTSDILIWKRKISGLHNFEKLWKTDNLVHYTFSLVKTLILNWTVGTCEKIISKYFNRFSAIGGAYLV